ncbi:MAG: sensor histidine kinase [Parafilimonas sp.]
MIQKIVILCCCLLASLVCFPQSPDRPVNDISADLKKSSNNADKAKLLLELALAYVHKPGEEKSDLDSALLLIKQAENINIKILHDKIIEAKTYFVYSNAYREKGIDSVGHLNIDKSIAVYKTLVQPEYLGEAYLEQSNYYLNYGDSGQNASRENCYDSAIAYFKKARLNKRQADVLKDLGDIKFNQANDTGAMRCLHEALNIYTSIGYKRLQGVYDLLGIVSSDKGDYLNGVKYGLLAVKAAEEDNDTTMQICTIYLRVGIAYSSWNDHYRAVEFLRKSMSIALKYKDIEAIKSVMTSLCYELVYTHDWKNMLNVIQSAKKKFSKLNHLDSLCFNVCYGYAYLTAQQYYKVQQQADILLRSNDTTKLDFNLLPMYVFLVKYYSATHQGALAVKYATKSFEFYKTVSSSIPYGYFLKAKADSVNGDYKSALDNYQNYRRINDSLLNETKSFQFAQLQVEYDTKQKEDSIKISQQNIQLLKTKNEADKKRAQLVRNVIIAASLLAITLLIIGYQFKQRNNNKLQHQQNAINHQNEILQQTVLEKNNLLEEKEWLVKEIHHRVKNNLQIVISLLSTQSKYLDNEEAIAAISESRHRMQAMSLIHQRLYQSENATSVNMQAYITELTEYLKTSFNGGKEINFLIHVDAIQLDISQAIPIGLILNEVITNAIKYAFEGREAGDIQIRMLKNNEQNIMLEIKDNGIGLPADFDLKNSTSMGMRLVTGLSKQINGKLIFENKNGVCVLVEFIRETKLSSISIV